MGTDRAVAARIARPFLGCATVAVVVGGCAGSGTASPTSTPAPAAATTATATATPAPPSHVPTPSAAPASQAPTIGLRADDGARIIAVDANPPVIHCTNDGCSDPVTVPGRRARDLTIDSPGVGIVKVRLLLPRHFDAQPSTRWPVLYLLADAGGHYQTWTEVLGIEALAAPTDVLVVMPDVGQEGYYSDWWNGGNGRPPSCTTRRHARGPRPGSMADQRNLKTATLLTDGRVLVAGGFGAADPLASAELFDPTTGAFRPAG